MCLVNAFTFESCTRCAKHLVWWCSWAAQLSQLSHECFIELHPCSHNCSFLTQCACFYCGTQLIFFCRYGVGASIWFSFPILEDKQQQQQHAVYTIGFLSSVLARNEEWKEKERLAIRVEEHSNLELQYAMCITIWRIYARVCDRKAQRKDLTTY